MFELGQLENAMRNCPPLTFYVVASAVGILSLMYVTGEMNLVNLLVSLVLILLISYVLMYLCRNNLTWVAWVLVLLPYVIVAQRMKLVYDAKQ